MDKLSKSLRLQNGVVNFDQIEELDNASSASSSPLLCNRSDDSEYNEHNFLTAALGDELQQTESSCEYIYPQTGSISTDEISELLSSINSLVKTRRRCKNCKSKQTLSSTGKKTSLCKRILQKATTGTHNHEKLPTTDVQESYASYEDITNFYQTILTDQGKKLAKNRIFVLETIIGQTERALEYGRRKSRQFIGSAAHLEAEGNLLVSKIKRQVLINTLYSIPESPSETPGRVTIGNLRCTLNSTRYNRHSPQLEHYYVCILQHKTTVYSTGIATPNTLGQIDFGGYFIFDDVANTFNIKVELHAIQLPHVPQNCFAFPLLRSTFQLPMMKLIGETQIGIMNRKNEKFSFTNCSGERYNEHKLSASIQTSIKWPSTLKGFLTIGIEKPGHHPIWNRRWCLLEDGKLKYYNHPSDENYCRPVGVLDLETCNCCDESDRKYLRQKTLALFIDNGVECKTYYLSTDTTEEFNLLRKNVEMVLRLITNWNMF